MKYLGIITITFLLGGTALHGADVIANAKLTETKKQIIALDGNQIARWITGQDGKDKQQEALHFAACTFYEHFKLSLPKEEDILLYLTTKYASHPLGLQWTIIMLLSAITNESESPLDMLNPLLKSDLCNAIANLRLEAWVQQFDTVTAPKSLLILLAEKTFSAITSPTISDSEEEPSDNNPIAEEYSSDD